DVKYRSTLKELGAPRDRAAVMYNPGPVPGRETFFVLRFTASSPQHKAKPIALQVHNRTEIETAIAELGSAPGSGLIFPPDNFITVHRELIVSLAAKFRIPAIYPYRYFAEPGGLLSYSVDAVDLFRRAAEYVNRILQGEKPADLPVQAPTKFEL